LKNLSRFRVLTPCGNVTTFVDVRARKVQIGQVWKNKSGETFLVTKIYHEALTTFAVLRKAGKETDPPLRVKVARLGTGTTLPGFTFAHESEHF